MRDLFDELQTGKTVDVDALIDSVPHLHPPDTRPRIVQFADDLKEVEEAYKRSWGDVFKDFKEYRGLIKQKLIERLCEYDAADEVEELPDGRFKATRGR
jgi:hypothetical protein